MFRAIVWKLDLQSYFYDGFWATPDTATEMNNTRFVAWGFKQDERVGFTEAHYE